MKKYILPLRLLILIVFAGLCMVSCHQVKEAKQLLQCDFRLKSVENLTLAGINVQQISSLNDLNILDAAKLTAAAVSGSLPLKFTLNIDVKNPNSGTAALNKLDWILFIDDQQMAEGSTVARLEVPPAGGITTMPLSVETDLAKAISGESGKSLLRFGLNLAGKSGKPSRITLKAKPTIRVGRKDIAYPGYISIRSEFGGN